MGFRLKNFSRMRTIYSKTSALILDKENFGLGQKVPRHTTFRQAEILSKKTFDQNIFSHKNLISHKNT